MDFPFSLDDLGDDYDFAYYVDMGDGTFVMDLLYKGEKIATAYVVANKMNDIDRESEITNIHISASDMQLIKVKGINCDSSVDESMNSLNELCKNYDDNGLLINIKYSDNDYYAGIFISEGEKINGIYFLLKR